MLEPGPESSSSQRADQRTARKQKKRSYLISFVFRCNSVKLKNCAYQGRFDRPDWTKITSILRRIIRFIVPLDLFDAIMRWTIFIAITNILWWCILLTNGFFFASLFPYELFGSAKHPSVRTLRERLSYIRTVRLDYVHNKVIFYGNQWKKLCGFFFGVLLFLLVFFLLSDVLPISLRKNPNV